MTFVYRSWRVSEDVLDRTKNIVYLPERNFQISYQNLQREEDDGEKFFSDLSLD